MAQTQPKPEVCPADHLDIVARVVRRTRGLVPWVDQSDIEDVAQLALVEAARDYAGECEVGAYLYRRVRCAVLDELRAMRLRADGREEMPDDCDRQADGGARTDISEALKALPAREYRVVMLFFWGGKSQGEISEVMGVNQSTVSRILESAKKSLRSCINPDSQSNTTMRGSDAKLA